MAIATVSLPWLVLAVLGVHLACIVCVSGQRGAKLCPGSNCTTNVCAAQGLNCCRCKLLESKLNEVCACCPAGYSCCQSNTSALHPTCCPNGWKCLPGGGCSQLAIAAPSKSVCSSCERMYLSITADDSIDEVYIDGVLYVDQTTGVNGWGSVRTVEIPADSKVIATNCSDIGHVVAGVLASTTNDYLITSANWKCTTQSYRNWMQPTFDDFSSPNAWPNAVVSNLNGWPDIHGPLPPISPAAGWIWTSNYSDPTIDHRVFCRGYFPSSGCNICYGNCTNLCLIQQKTCCGCELSGLGPSLVCNCCPKDHKCCPSPAGGSTCCPNNSSCRPNGQCLISIEDTSAQISCSDSCRQSVSFPRK